VDEIETLEDLTNQLILSMSIQQKALEFSCNSGTFEENPLKQFVKSNQKARTDPQNGCPFPEINKIIPKVRDVVDLVKDKYKEDLSMAAQELFSFSQQLLGGKYTSVLLEVFQTPFEPSEDWAPAFRNFIITSWN